MQYVILELDLLAFQWVCPLSNIRIMFVNYFVQILSKLDPDLRNVVQNDERVTS